MDSVVVMAPQMIRKVEKCDHHPEQLKTAISKVCASIILNCFKYLLSPLLTDQKVG